MTAKKKPIKRIALTLSLWLILIWMVLGTGTSLAWFTDEDEEVQNIFHFAEFELQVEYRDKNGEYQDLEGATKVFDENALYEPGYVQVVYLRVTNQGEVPFNFKTAVSVMDYTEATNVFGTKFHLQDHLKFGIISAKTEPELTELVATRDAAKTYANTPLSNYSTESARLDPQKTVYLALILRMPEEVDNIANYRSQDIPRVDLGLIVSATQLGTPENE